MHEAARSRARDRQADPGWQPDYRATRPRVERKLAHLMRRRACQDNLLEPAMGVP